MVWYVDRAIATRDKKTIPVTMERDYLVVNAHFYAYDYYRYTYIRIFKVVMV